MKPQSLALAFGVTQMFIVGFYDDFEFLQTYPKIYEDALGSSFLIVSLFLWQMEKNNAS